jgi:Zn-dependent metalloprotease
VYDAEHSEDLPGSLARSEGDPPVEDACVDEAYDGAGETWGLYNNVYGRCSIDDRGMVIVQTVHYGEDFDNAFWNGEQMVYGDGDGELFARFTMDLDIIAHELTHGVTQYEAALRYWYQSGALNESFSDVFGILVKQYKLHQDVKEADWLIGANVLIGDEYALRSMKAPGTAYQGHPIIGDDPQPATMDDYNELPPWQDNGGVHINSGIPNHAFYLAAMEIGGYAWEKAGLIWYRTLCDKLGNVANFVRAATATILAAKDEFGSGSLEEKAVQKAWKNVKVL